MTKKSLHTFFLVLGMSVAGALSAYAQQPQTEFEMKDGDTTYTMVKYTFCILKTGPNRTQGDSAVAEIQKGHMAHINKLAKEGKISLAGPFENGGEWRGILIFNTHDMELAKQWQSADPAIRAGRLVCECANWWAARGSSLR